MSDVGRIEAATGFELLPWQRRMIELALDPDFRPPFVMSRKGALIPVSQLRTPSRREALALANAKKPDAGAPGLS